MNEIQSILALDRRRTWEEAREAARQLNKVTARMRREFPYCPKCERRVPVAMPCEHMRAETTGGSDEV